MKYLLSIILLISLSSYAGDSDLQSSDGIKVVVADNPGIGFGVMLTRNCLSIRLIDRKDLPGDYILPEDIDSYFGKTVKSFIEGGQPVRVSDIADFSMQDKIDHLVEEDKKLHEAIQKLQFCKDRCDEEYEKYVKDIQL